ncbi:hypothetical protein AVEN_203404-1 [Araneus ventricosus]|uniref:Integrase p58-like C-terminal domain-containing protein n=1 Tax=Araneus ventricosus TaxID=182803 RepID=A0A4Y2I956_ARAVE|nr:hypothetical protein AVEN_203404-1 [Araneus ventricosus]
METYISVNVLTTTTVDPWSSCEIQKAQIEDPAIKPILEKKLNSVHRPSWQEIAPESPETKRYWALWDSLHLKDGVQDRPFPVTIKGNRYVMDNFTKWPEAIPIPDQEASTVAEELDAEHEVTELTPAEMLFGRTLRLPFDILVGRPSETLSSPNEYMKKLEANLESVHASSKERIKLASERMKTRYNSRATDHHFKKGDLVWMYNPKRRRGPSPKLQQNRKRPYTIVKKLNDVVCRVRRSPNAKAIHINRLSPYRATDHSSI